ncbi:hypothetical protein B0T18DRAFT_174852 [Schizothecium vesticola]|uniref:Uncharacterized protein n=1 Tax=Schizothecium vesticola TaxID=314040 RepID=A0AA40EPF6_9PEZI|nr:hypothetical protein B0T18DRAFT_174852 [Schizothecium vesticola]
MGPLESKINGSFLTTRYRGSRRRAFPSSRRHRPIPARLCLPASDEQFLSPTPSLLAPNWSLSPSTLAATHCCSFSAMERQLEAGQGEMMETGASTPCMLVPDHMSRLLLLVAWSPSPRSERPWCSLPSFLDLYHEHAPPPPVVSQEELSAKRDLDRGGEPRTGGGW